MDGERSFPDEDDPAAWTDSRALAHLQQLFSAQSVEQAWTLHMDLMGSFGFEWVTYVYSPLSGSFDALEDTLILSNVPKRVLEEYQRRGHWRIAYYLSRAEAAGVDCISWSPPPADHQSPEEAATLAFRRAHGFVAGYSISLRGLSCIGRAGVGLGARRDLDQEGVDRIWARHGDTIKLLNQAFHLRICTLPHDPVGSGLTKRQHEVLEWAGAGKTVRDIATLMGVSVPTVEKHLRLARDKLGAQTTAQALVKASARNQILRMDFSIARKKEPK